MEVVDAGRELRIKSVTRQRKRFFRKLFVPTLLPGKIQYTDNKENQIFLICKEIESGAVAKSYMRKGFLIYEEIVSHI